MASEFEVLSTLHVIKHIGNKCVLIEPIVMCGVGIVNGERYNSFRSPQLLSLFC